MANLLIMGVNMSSVSGVGAAGFQQSVVGLETSKPEPPTRSDNNEVEESSESKQSDNESDPEPKEVKLQPELALQQLSYQLINNFEQSKNTLKLIEVGNLWPQHVIDTYT